jgi:membrane-associated phospholipid phosphatase
MKKFFNIISLVFQPLLMPTYGILMLTNMDVFQALPLNWRIMAVVGTLLFTGILPATPILLMIKKGDVHDLFISRREERTLPYLFSFLAYIFWTFFMYRILQLPLFMVAMGIGSAISIVLITLINLKWKISAHLSGIGGLAGGLFGICFRMGINPLPLIITVLFVSALVALARIELKAHTPGQTLAGFSLGFLAVFLPCVFI